MNRSIKIAVLAGGTSLLAGCPVFAQDLNALNPLPAIGGALGGLDLDPLHIFTPAPPPAAPVPVAEAPVPRHHHRHRLAHRAVARHHARLHVKAHSKKA